MILLPFWFTHHTCGGYYIDGSPASKLHEPECYEPRIVYFVIAIICEFMCKDLPIFHTFVGLATRIA